MRVVAIHPGEQLGEELKELRMSAAEFARRLRVPTNRITQILHGRRAITGDTALRLGHFFGTSAEFWLNLQSRYEIRLAERKAGKSIRALPTLKQQASDRPANIRRPSPAGFAFARTKATDR
jgi:addiction module HigA family antidote